MREYGPDEKQVVCSNKKINKRWVEKETSKLESWTKLMLISKQLATENLHPLTLEVTVMEKS